MTAKTNVQEFIEEQRRSLKLEFEQIVQDQQDNGCATAGIDPVDVEEGRCIRQKGASSVVSAELPDTRVADNGCQLADAENFSTKTCGVRFGCENDGHSQTSIESQTENDPLVEPLPLSCDGRCLNKEQQTFLAETLVQSESPLTFTRSNARNTPPSPSGRPANSSAAAQNNSPPGLGNNSGTVRMLRRGAGEYGRVNKPQQQQQQHNYLGGGLGLAHIVQQHKQQQKQKQSAAATTTQTKKPNCLGFGLNDVVQRKQQQRQDNVPAQSQSKPNYLGLGFSSSGGDQQTQQQQQRQRQDLNLNLNNVNKPKHNRHVHYNSNVIDGVDATIHEYGVGSASNVYKSNLNQRNEHIKNSGKRVFIDSRVVEVANNKSVQTDIKNIRNNLIQEDNHTTYLQDTAIINNNNSQPVRGIITNPNRRNNINLNINNNFSDDDQRQPQSFYISTDESSELELTDAGKNTNTASDSDSSDTYRTDKQAAVLHRDNQRCVCSSPDCGMHHNSRSPILHRLDRSSGIGTSSGSTGIGTTSSRLSHMDKPRSILSNRYYTSTTSPRERLLSDLKHTYVPGVFDGFSFTDRSEEYERERVKKELYQNELRLQIEEKRRQATMRENQERVEQELENRRLEQQLLRMHEEELRDEERRTLRRNSEDLQRRAQEIGTRATYQRRHTDSESSLHKMPSPYSPPMTRRNAHNMHTTSSNVFDTSPVTNRYNAQALRNRMDSLSDSYGTYNTYGGGRSTVDGASVFNRYDSLSRIDALKQQNTALSRLDNLTLTDSYSNRIQRRHSATHQDLSASRRSPKLQRRSSSSRFDADSLPIPLLKAASHSPVARDLRNATAVNSNKYSDSLRRLEEKWQIPAVQKNIMSYDVYPDGHNRNILTQLGSMRMQLQQEQLRMDEALRRRGYSSQYKAVNFH